MKKDMTILTSGKRKSAKASASLRKGSGYVRINKQPIGVATSPMYALRMQEPLLLAGDIASQVDIDVLVRGGGYASQADATRLAIAKALVEFNSSLEETFSEYDRTLLVADVRRKEPKKPNNRGRARARRQKSYR